MCIELSKKGFDGGHWQSRSGIVNAVQKVHDKEGQYELQAESLRMRSGKPCSSSQNVWDYESMSTPLLRRLREEYKYNTFRSFSWPCSVVQSTDNRQYLYQVPNIMSLWAPPPEPPTPLGRYRVLSPLAGIRVSPLQLGAMSIGDKWTKFGMGAMDKEASSSLANKSSSPASD